MGKTSRARNQVFVGPTLATASIALPIVERRSLVSDPRLGEPDIPTDFPSGLHSLNTTRSKHSVF
jgi:hypothetical protein